MRRVLLALCLLPLASCGIAPSNSQRLTEAALEEKKKFAIEQNITSLNNRVNELGVAEPIIQQQGSDRIVVQLPGVQDTAKAKEIIGRTATLELTPAQVETLTLSQQLGSLSLALRSLVDADKTKPEAKTYEEPRRSGVNILRYGINTLTTAK